MANEEIIYAIVHNIPVNYHSLDLRNYFSQFIESKGFNCFHFRRRPEIRNINNNPNSSNSQLPVESLSNSLCCFISLLKFEEFLLRYHRKHWIDRKGNVIFSKCLISHFKINGKYKDLSHVYENFTSQDLKKLPEFNPPLIMPQGNVGTPTLFFLKLIQECRLPPRIITKLGLVFPMTAGKKIYSNVPLDYGTTTFTTHKCIKENAKTSTGHEISDIFIQNSLEKNTRISSKEQEDGEDTSTSEEDVDECEEWERHEAFYDDVTSQQRTKERLYEEEVEVTWEKGGSGLVFHTDASFWNTEAGDFDIQTSDEWDIDMSIYYEKDSGDKDARDFIQIQKERFLRNGRNYSDSKKIGRFEKFTKGVGRKILEKQGWSDGHGLGRTISGISEALENEGQHPHCKRGLGYYGEKLNRHPKNLKKATRKVIISTIYDNHKITDPGETLLRTNPAYHLKYRDEIKFTKPAAPCS